MCAVRWKKVENRCVNHLLMFLEKLMVNSRLFVVKLGGVKCYTWILMAESAGSALLNPMLFKDQPQRYSTGGDPQTRTEKPTQNWHSCINAPISIGPCKKVGSLLIFISNVQNHTVPETSWYPNSPWPCDCPRVHPPGDRKDANIQLWESGARSAKYHGEAD